MSQRGVTTSVSHTNSSPMRGLRSRVAARWARLRSPGAPTEPRPFAMLRRRLITTNLLVTTLILLVVSVAIYLFEANLELAQIDVQLAREASGQIASGIPKAAPVTNDPTETPYDPSSANFFSVVVSRSGDVLQDDDQVQRFKLPDWNAAGPVLTGEQASSYATVERGSMSFRLYTAPIIDNGRIAGAVQSGISLDAHQQQLHDLIVALVALDILIIMLMLGSSVALTERALRPAREAFERQRQFAAGASHELRTPLALIRSLAELVADHRCVPAGEPSALATSQQDSVAGDAKEIIHEVDYMTRLVTDLLLLARDEHDRLAMNWVMVDVCKVMRGVVEKFEPLAAARGITLTSALIGRSDSQLAPVVEGDPDRLRELALILIENAVRYTPRGGSVFVGLTLTRGAVIRGERHGHVTLTVRDTGVGIAAEDQPHVFEPFYRANSSTLRRASAADGVTASELGGAGGSGLGLALAHWIVEAHRGEISLTSAPGKGTTFTVVLPLVAQGRPGRPSDQFGRQTPKITRPV